MSVSFKELRRVCQAPVRAGNDVAGLLFGDRISLPFTKLFVDLGLSPSIATVGMLVTGLAGSALQFGAPLVVLVGSLLLLLYYVLDCVDGEVARWRKIEHARWGYYEYLFHFVVKPAAFLSVAFAVHGELGHMALLVAGATAAVATLWLKLFLALPGIVFVGSVFGRGASGDRPYRSYLDGARSVGASESSGGDDEPFELRLDRVTLRALATNFDVGLALLVIASLLDLVIEPFAFLGLGDVSLRALWVLYYGVVLPLDFLDYVRSYVGRGHFDKEMERMLGAAHRFTLPAAPADED